MKGIYKKYRNSGGIGKGYVIIPPDQQENAREDYIKRCVRRCRVSILLEDGGGVAHDCYVSKQVMKDIEFPEKFGITGSPVLFHLDAMHNVPMIYASFQKEDESELLQENERKLKGENGENFAEIGVRGENGEIYLNVDSDESNGGIVNINVKNQNRTGKMNINIIGDSDIYTSNECKIKSNNSVDVRVKNVTTDDEYSVKVDKTNGIVFNDNVLDSFIADINKLTDQINLTEDKVNAIIGIIRDNWIPVVTDGGAALKALFASVLDLQNTTVDDIKDENIKN